MKCTCKWRYIDGRYYTKGVSVGRTFNARVDEFPWTVYVLGGWQTSVRVVIQTNSLVEGMLAGEAVAKLIATLDADAKIEAKFLNNEACRYLES